MASRKPSITIFGDLAYHLELSLSRFDRIVDTWVESIGIAVSPVTEYPALRAASCADRPFSI